MYGWIIFALILLGLLAILFIPLSVSVSAADNAPLTIRLQILFFRFSLYPKKRKTYRRMSARAWKKKKQAARLKKSKKQSKKASESKKAKKTTKDHIRLFRLLLSLLSRTHKGLLSAFRIRLCRIYVAVGTEDAAKTAITYGIVAQVLATILEITDQFVRTRRAKECVRIYPDFCAQKILFDISLFFTSNLFHLAIYALKAAMAYMQIKAEQTKKNKPVEDTNNG